MPTAVDHDMAQVGKTGPAFGHFGLAAEVFRRRVAAVDAQREPLIILTVERSAGGPLWTGRVAALTGLIAARIVLITKAQEALLARAADTGLTSARCVGEGVGAQTDVLTTALPALVTRRTVAAGLATILAVAIRDAEP